MRLQWPVDPVHGVRYPQYNRNAELDGTVYADPEIPAISAITAVISAPAVLRATTVKIRTIQGGPILPGHQFGIDERLYEVGEVVSRVADVTTVNIMPPLRAAVAENASIRWTNAICLMRCMNMDDAFIILSGMRRTVVNLEFLEYI
jgi:hypothetical protein